MARIHKHVTPSTLGLAAAATLATKTTAGVRQAQIDNPHPAVAGKWVIFSGGMGFYIRNATSDENTTDKFCPAYTLEEATRWDTQDAAAAALAACSAEMNSDGADAGDFSLSVLSYEDALKQERDSLQPEGTDGPVDPESDPSIDALMDELFGDASMAD